MFCQARAERSATLAGPTAYCASDATYGTNASKVRAVMNLMMSLGSRKVAAARKYSGIIVRWVLYDARVWMMPALYGLDSSRKSHRTYRRISRTQGRSGSEARR